MRLFVDESEYFWGRKVNIFCCKICMFEPNGGEKLLVLGEKMEYFLQ